MEKLKITKEYTVYKFKELNENIQNELLEKEVNYQIETYCEIFLKNDMEQAAKNLLEKYFNKNIKLKNVYYDLSYSQGSGAMIEFSGYYYNKFFEVKHFGHYYHEYSFEIYEDNFTDKQYNKLKEKIIAINSELAKNGYIFINSNNFIDFAKEQLEENLFLQNGEIFIK